MNPFSNRQPQYIPLDQQSEGDDGEVMIEVDADKHAHPMDQMPLPGTSSIYGPTTTTPPTTTELPPSYPHNELQSSSSSPFATITPSSIPQPHVHCAECDALSRKRGRELKGMGHTVGWTAFGSLCLFMIGYWILLVIRARNACNKS